MGTVGVLANSHCSCILPILAMQETCKTVMCTWPPALHAGNPPDIPCQGWGNTHIFSQAGI